MGNNLLQPANRTTGQAIEIFLVDDDQGDIDLTLEILEQSKLMLNFHVFKDGMAVMDHLQTLVQQTNPVMPDLILLDLNMPKKDGREVLGELKTNRKLKHIPVVILTTSDAEIDILKSYNLGANCYVKKPVGLLEFTAVVQSIEHFWFTVVKLPPKRLSNEEQMLLV